jgi:hypothetical protein
LVRPLVKVIKGHRWSVPVSQFSGINWLGSGGADQSVRFGFEQTARLACGAETLLTKERVQVTPNLL